MATVLGLAFKAYDPDGLLGGEEDLGITCALVPTAMSGVEIGERHLPSGASFMNGPTRGKDVFVPLDFVIGGPGRIGDGWRMLVQSLAAGRAISLPSFNRLKLPFTPMVRTPCSNGVAVGGIALGGFACGLFALAGVATGIVAFGGCAFGWVAAGGLALAWHTALGGVAIAAEYSLGGVAIAAEANSDAARAFMANSSVMTGARAVLDHSRWFLLLAVMPVFVVLRARKSKS